MFPWFYRFTSLHLAPFWPFPAAQARRAGSLDGGEQIPAETDRMPPGWVVARLQAGQQELNRLCGDWIRVESRLLDRLETASLRTADAAALAAEAEQRAGRSRARHQALLHRSAELDEQLNPPGDWYFPSWLYVLGLMGLAVLDAPLVYLAFQAFGLDRVSTWLLSGLTAILTSAIGHFAGSLVRRVGITDRHQLAALGTLAVSLMLAVGFLREDGLAVVQAAAGVTMRPGRAFAGLLLVSLASLAVALLLAAHHRLEPLARELRQARREARQAESALTARRQHLLAARRREAVLRNRLACGRRTLRERAAAVEAEALQMIGHYTAANVLAREPHQLVPCLEAGNLPRLRLPEFGGEAADPI